MKKYYIAVCIIILLFLSTILILYRSNPLVKKGKIGIVGYFILCAKTLSKDCATLNLIAEYSYKHRDSDNDLENYGEYLFAKSANYGNAEAMYRLGAIKSFRKKDEKNGIPLLTKAGESGSSKANYILGLYYISKEKDEKGLELLKKAGEQGDEEAQKLYKRMNSYVNYDKANNLLEKAKNESTQTVDVDLEFANF